MPAVAIEVRWEYSRDEEIEIIEAVQDAMVQSLKIPARTITTRFMKHAPHRFTAPPDKGDRYTLVTIDLFAGRSDIVRNALFHAIVQNLDRLGIPPDHVKTLLREASRDSWGIRGGMPASMVDLGYEVNI